MICLSLIFVNRGHRLRGNSDFGTTSVGQYRLSPMQSQRTPKAWNFLVLQQQTAAIRYFLLGFLWNVFIKYSCESEDIVMPGEDARSVGRDKFRSFQKDEEAPSAKMPMRNYTHLKHLFGLTAALNVPAWFLHLWEDKIGVTKISLV